MVVVGGGVVPSRTDAWMIGSSVAAFRSATAYVKLSPVSRQIPPKTHNTAAVVLPSAELALINFQ